MVEVPQVREGSREEVALKLLHLIAAQEGRDLSSSASGGSKADRKWTLDTYAECLWAIIDPVGRVAGKHKPP
jgi:hypothetical protein